MKIYIFFSSEKVNRDILEAYTRDVKERSSSDVTSAIVLVHHRKVCVINLLQ